ncbi:cupin domain-containing protein [Bradyrhizobium sp. SYSU BS000235]|uniref:cupin domain-containing protein n=1 Tax=Bradyrhizobium sp. SYSU BS000235 TaxID=3411332 RepID=UPI003C71BE51
MSTVEKDAVGREQSSAVRAYKRSPALSNSRSYKGIVVSEMAGTADNNGAFDVVIGKLTRGTEPPPHVHSREDEFFYVLSGEMKFYVDGEVFLVTAGECMFCPRLTPHAFRVASEEVQCLTFITPGGFNETINKMNAPAKRMDVANDSDETYAEIDLTETIKLFAEIGVQFLTPDQISAEMPLYLTA